MTFPKDSSFAQEEQRLGEQDVESLKATQAREAREQPPLPVGRVSVDKEDLEESIHALTDLIDDGRIGEGTRQTAEDVRSRLARNLPG